jgi:uncharacterized membrane protein (DUF4010 family)
VNPSETLLDTMLLMSLLAGCASGLLIGVERGWRQRGEADGTRVAGVRTFTLIGGFGSLVALIAREVSTAVAAIMLCGLVALLVVGFLREQAKSAKRDATTMVAAMVTLALGLLGGAGHIAFAIAGAALTTFVLAMRNQAHHLVRSLDQIEVQAIARFAVIAVAVLPFLPNAQYGPYNAWNPFKLWLVLVLIIGFSIVAYVANRLIGQNKGTIVTALIGGTYSSTAVTASLASRLREPDAGPFATGIALASAVMYVRVFALTAILAPAAALPLLWLLAPAGFAAFAVSAITWQFERTNAGTTPRLVKKPFEILPALGFLLAMGAASLLVRWAQFRYGEAGGAWSLFIAGSLDVDAAIVTLGGLPRGSVDPAIAALALGGTVAVNMAFKIAIVLANARLRAGSLAATALLTSLVILIATLIWRLIEIAP